MSFDLRPLFTPSYWLTFDPPAVWSGAGRSLVVVFIGMLVASVIVRRLKLRRAEDRHQAAVYRRVASLLSVMGAVGLALFFFSYEEIRLFGARFLYLAWLAGTAWWAVSVYRFARRDVPEARERERQRAERDKYMPGRRK